MDQCQLDPNSTTLGEIRDILKYIGPCPYCSDTYHVPLLEITESAVWRRCFRCHMKYEIVELCTTLNHMLCYADTHGIYNSCSFDYCDAPHWNRNKDGEKNVKTNT